MINLMMEGVRVAKRLGKQSLAALESIPITSANKREG
jgi:hypothetical protein